MSWLDLALCWSLILCQDCRVQRLQLPPASGTIHSLQPSQSAHTVCRIMPAVLSRTPSPPLETSTHLLHPLPLLSSTTCQSASVIFIIISVLLAINRCYRPNLYKRMPPPLSLPNPLNEMQDSRRSQTALTTLPAHNEAFSVQTDHLSLVGFSGLPKPTVRQFQQPFPNAQALGNQNVTTNPTCVIGSSPRSATRRDTVQKINGCRRHVMVWG